MRIKAIEDVEGLTHSNQTNKRKHKAFCIFPPFLTQCLYSESNDPKEILVQMVQAIADRSILSLAEDKVNNPDQEIKSIEESEEEESTNPQKIIMGKEDNQELTFQDPSGETEENFYHILLFLWAMVHRNDKLQAIMTIPVTDSEAVEWSNNIHFFKLKQPPKNSFTNINKKI